MQFNKKIILEIYTYFNSLGKTNANKIHNGSIIHYLKINKEIKQYIEQLQKEYFQNESLISIVMLLFELYNKELCLTCKQCSNLLSIKKILKEKDYCSRKCLLDSGTYAQRIKDGCMKKYGVENVFQLQTSKDKSKQTCKERYGTEFAQQSEQVQNKIKNTNLKKYGNKCSLRNNKIQEKVKKSVQEHYGVKYNFQAKEVKEKIKQTCLKKFGTENPQQNKEIKEKTKQTCLKKFCVANPMQNPGIKEKANITLFKNYGIINASELSIEKSNNKSWKHILSWKDYIIPLFNRENYFGLNKEKIYKWKCVKCGNEFESYIYNTNHLHNIDQIIPRCLNCYPFIENIGRSKIENEVAEFCNSYSLILGENPKFNKKCYIKPYELDIIFPLNKIAIEVNGDYYHSLESEKYELGYHLMKTNMCENIGIHLIHIFEHEWVNKKEEIKNNLKQIFFKSLPKFEQDELILNRCWFSSKQEILGYKLIKNTEPIIQEINFNNKIFHIENCGQLIYQKIKN